ncbi:hypothetical protein Tco_0966041 [Tanacetum coccineum]
MEGTMNSTEFIGKLQLVCHKTNSFYDFEWPNVPWTELTSFYQVDLRPSRRYFNMDHYHPLDIPIENSTNGMCRSTSLLTKSIKHDRNMSSASECSLTLTFCSLGGKHVLIIQLGAHGFLRDFENLDVNKLSLSEIIDVDGVMTLGVLGSHERNPWLFSPLHSGISCCWSSQMVFGAQPLLGTCQKFYWHKVAIFRFLPVGTIRASF